jgi:hypothetical protein
MADQRSDGRRKITEVEDVSLKEVGHSRSPALDHVRRKVREQTETDPDELVPKFHSSLP